MIGGYFSHFEIWNEGDASACDVTISLMDKDKKNWFEKKEVDVIRPNETIIFKPVLRARPEGEYCVVCDYKNISDDEDKNVYSTWLLINMNYASKDSEIYVVSGELKFKYVNF